MDSLSPKISPKFMKPSEVFKMRKKTRLSFSPSSSLTKSNSLLKSPPSKVPFSPLKCLQNYHNSPIRDTISPLKSQLTPKSKRSRIRNSFPIVKKSPRKSSGKRQLNFHNHINNNDKGFIIDSNDENANLEPAIDLNNYQMTNVKKENDNDYDNSPKKALLNNNELIIDWSLKTKLRFTSTKPFPWRGNFRASEEATGISSFVRCIHRESLKSESSQSVSSPSSYSNPHELDTSWPSLLHQHSLVWSHPNLPWICLFPRCPNTTPGAPLAHKPPTFSIIPNTPLADALHSDWCVGLKSVYQLLKARQCPYFYLCANTFTALFRASGIGGCDEIQVLITPTTDGFRNALTQEAIQFTMPFNEENNSIENDFTQYDDTHNNKSSSVIEPNNDAVIVEDEEHNVWLESLGLSQHDFPSVQNTRKKKRLISSVSRKRSLVMIKGMSDSQLFLNFLMNTRICIPNNGPFSGVPPTLLSPVAFHGATLQPLKLTQSRADNETSSDACYNLELTGPILPNAVCGLLKLFKETQNNCFKGLFFSYEPTIPLANCNSLIGQYNMNSSKAFATENLKDCGIEREFLNYLCSREHQSDGPLSEVISDKNGITYF